VQLNFSFRNKFIILLPCGLLVDNNTFLKNVLSEYLRHYVNEDQTTGMSGFLSQPKCTIPPYMPPLGLPPLSCCSDAPPPKPSALKKPLEPQYNYDDYISELRSRLQTVHHHGHKKLIVTKGKSKELYDKTSGEMKLHVGDKVLLFDETVRRGKCRKLSAQWIGPHSITEIDKVYVTITRGRKVTKVHVNRLKPLCCIRWEDGKHRVFALLQMKSVSSS
jgi:hypothetical protein